MNISPVAFSTLASLTPIANSPVTNTLVTTAAPTDSMVPTATTATTELQLEPLIRPEAIGWWPLTTATWLVLIITLCLFAALAWKLITAARRYGQLRQQQKLASVQLKKVCDHYRHQLTTPSDQLQIPASETLCRSLNILSKNYLKQLALQNPKISHQVINEVLATSGSTWSEMMQTCISPYAPCWPFTNHFQLSARTKNILAQGSYRPAPKLPIDLLQQEIQQWIHNTNPQQLGQLQLATLHNNSKEQVPC